MVSRSNLSARQVQRLAENQPAYRVLIIEDQLENRLLLKKLMESVGFHVYEAMNGQQGVEQFIRWQPHFIWMDRRMPVMDGIVATQKIRALPDGNKVKIVAITASAFVEQRQEFLNAGVDDVIGKPYRDTEIYACMNKHLGVRFIYEEPDNKKPPMKSLFDEQRIKQLPEALWSELQQAAMSLDIEQSLAVIEKIGAIDRAWADMLAERVNQFDFETIINLSISVEKYPLL